MSHGALGNALNDRYTALRRKRRVQSNVGSRTGRVLYSSRARRGDYGSRGCGGVQSVKRACTQFIHGLAAASKVIANGYWKALFTSKTVLSRSMCQQALASLCATAPRAAIMCLPPSLRRW